MSAYINNLEYYAPVLNGRVYNAKLNGNTIFVSPEVPYPPYYEDSRDCLLLVTTDSTGDFIIPTGPDYYNDPGIAGFDTTAIYNWVVYVYPLNNPVDIEYHTFTGSVPSQFDSNYFCGGISIGSNFSNISANTDYVIGISPADNDYTKNWLIRFGFYTSDNYNIGSNSQTNKNCLKRVYNLDTYACRNGSLNPFSYFIEYRFQNCQYLERFADLVNEYIYIVEDTEMPDEILMETFSNCTRLSSVLLPELRCTGSARELGDRCFYKTFYSCQALKTTIPLVPPADSNYHPYYAGTNYQDEMYAYCNHLRSTTDSKQEPCRYYSGTDTYVVSVINSYFQYRKYISCALLEEPEEEIEVIGTPSSTVMLDEYYRAEMYQNCTNLKFAAKENSFYLNPYSSISSDLAYFRFAQYMYCGNLAASKGLGRIINYADFSNQYINAPEGYRAYQYETYKIKVVLYNTLNQYMTLSEFDYYLLTLGEGNISCLSRFFAGSSLTTSGDTSELRISVPNGNGTSTVRGISYITTIPTTNPSGKGLIYGRSYMDNYSNILAWYKAQ